MPKFPFSVAAPRQTDQVRAYVLFIASRVASAAIKNLAGFIRRPGGAGC
jgi:hypothetical protein